MARRLVCFGWIWAMLLPACAQDWPQWRGPVRMGETTLAHKAPWPAELAKLWSIEAGPGLASPVVVGDSAYLLTRDGEFEVVSRHRLTDGKKVWSDRYRADFLPNSQASSPALFPESGGKGPFASPLFHDGKLYTLGVGRILSCYRADTGKLLWRNHFFKVEIPEKPVYVCPPCGNECDKLTFEAPGICETCRMPLNAKDVETSATFTGTWPNYYGAAASPLAAGKAVITHVSQPAKGRLMVVDAASGEALWHWDGPAQVASSPVMAGIHDVAQIVTLTRESVTGVALEDGRELWRFPLTSNAQIVTPVVVGNKVVFATYRGPLACLDVVAEEGGFSARQVWENQDVRTQTSTPALSDGVLYCHSTKRRGQLAAVDVETGQTLWLGEADLGRHASVVALADKVVALTLKGELIVFEKNRSTYKPIRKYSVSDRPVWTMPILFESKILIKEATMLTLWGE